MIPGAVGDGITDDTAAVQAAMDAFAGGSGELLLGPYRYKVTTVQWRPGVTLVGDGVPNGSALIGSPGYDILMLPTAGGISYFGLRGLELSGGRRGISYSVGPTANYCTYVRAQEIQISGPAEECVYSEGAIEEWSFASARLIGGKYGFRHANVDHSGGNNYLDKCTFQDVLTAGQSINGWRLEAKTGGTNTWLSPIINTAGQDGFYADGGFRSLVFLNLNTEGNGQSGKKVRTTGTLAAGSNLLTVASAVGYEPGDPLTVEGAGFGGADLHTTIVEVIGNLLTLAQVGTTAVNGLDVTNASFDDFRFANSIAGPGDVTFLGGIIGGEGAGGKLRYAINGYGTNHITCVGVETAGGIPIYLPTQTGAIVCPNATVRYPGAKTRNFGAETLRSFMVAGPKGSTRIPSGPGSDITLGMRDSNDNGTGTHGNVNARRHDPNRTEVFRFQATNPQADATNQWLLTNQNGSVQLKQVVLGPAIDGRRILQVIA